MNETVISQAPQTSKAPVSERKAAANRANAQRSTGPRTPKGKAASSLNALRHGILARAAFNLTIEGEERRAEFDALVAGLAQEFQPRTMSEHMTVQQLAGCYWRLAKVWTFETESAWRSNTPNNLGVAELGQLEKEGFGKIMMEVIDEQDDLFEEAGLGNPTIPSGPSASTILRYQGSINTMMFKCLAILERRRKEHVAQGDAFEEQDYTNEPTEEVAAAEAAPEKPVKAPVDGALHERTQKDSTDAPVSSHENVKSESPAAIADEIISKTPPEKS
jgi:hypothetical protein